MKLTLCLPGGGACGRWQAGVLKYLFDAGVLAHVDLVCGTSVGGLNTLMLGKYIHDFKKAADLWAAIKTNKDIFDGMLQFNNFFDFLGMASQAFRDNKGAALLKPTGLYNMLDREFSGITLKDLLVPVIITTTDLNTGERVVIKSEINGDFPANELGKMTSAIPIAFPPVTAPIPGGMVDLCIDGGLGRNVPVDLAIENGSTHIILIGTSPDKYPRENIKPNIIPIALRLQDIIMRAFEEDCWKSKENYELLSSMDPVKYPKIKILDIYPETSTGSALDFSNVAQFDAGYKYAETYLLPEVLEAFLQ